jgi:hypothetical protein
MHKNRFNSSKEKNIIEMYQSGTNTVDIAKKYNTYNTSIRRVLLRNNINIRNYSQAVSRIQGNLFSFLSLTREESYFLGLLITDGCISRTSNLTLGLQEQDVYMLQKFANFLGPKNKVYKYFHTAHNKYQYQVSVGNIEICKNLNKLAIFKNKSFDLELLIPINFDILRGIIDGDGYVKKGTISISSKSKKFLEQIQIFYTSYNIISYLHSLPKNNYVLNVHKKKYILFLHSKMYCSTDLFLIRKKNKYGPVV